MSLSPAALAASPASLVQFIAPSKGLKARYTADGGKLQVTFDTSGQKDWRAIDQEALFKEVDVAQATHRAHNHRAWTVARGNTLADLKVRLGRYLADRAAGTVDASGRSYGF